MGTKIWSTLWINHYIFIYILKNDVVEFVIYDSNRSNSEDNYNPAENLSYSWTMVLRENDRVHLRVSWGKQLGVPVWFNGHLLKQQV